MKRYGPFKADFAYINFSDSPNDPWAKTKVELSGLPRNWKETVVGQIWFDSHQFVYQNFKQGNLSPEYYDALVKSWNIDTTSGGLIAEPIRCFVNVVRGKTTEGSFAYIIDSNNDFDFSDEKKMLHPLILNEDKADSLSQYAIKVDQDYVIGDQVKRKKVPVLLVRDSLGSMFYNIPQHAEAQLEKSSLKVSSLFMDAVFRGSTNVFIQESQQQVLKEEYFKIGENTYQNLGVNFNNQTLIIKKVNSNANIFSPQVGYQASAFKGINFITGDTIDLESYRGKYVYINFWGSWCKPCMEKMPILNDIYKKVDPNRIHFLGIVSDKEDRLRETLENEDIIWPQILSNSSNNIVKLYNINRFPTSFLIDPDGQIVAKDLLMDNLLDSLSHY